jgi:hypothetical protein
MNEGGNTFNAVQLWNSLSLELRKKSTINAFKKSLFKLLLNEQSSLHHFNP